MTTNQWKEVFWCLKTVKSEITFREYLKRLEKFRMFCNVDNFDSLSRIDPTKLQEMLEDYIMLRKKQINPNSIPVEFFAIKSFLEINEVELKWRKLTKLFPAKIKKTGRRAYTTQFDLRPPSIIGGVSHG